MKKNVVIVVLFLTIVGLLSWQICQPKGSSLDQKKEASVSADDKLSELKAEIISYQESTSMAPVSEADKKLEKLGFGTSAETHKLVVK